MNTQKVKCSFHILTPQKYAELKLVGYFTLAFHEIPNNSELQRVKAKILWNI